MRVQSNIAPELITIEPYLNKDEQVFVRIRANIHQVTIDEQSMYEYDEYTFITNYYEGLSAHLQENYDDYIASGYCQEINANASYIVDVLQQIKEVDEALLDIEYQSILEEA